MTEPQNLSSSQALSQVVIRLLRGVLYQQDDPGLWQQMLNLQARVIDYVAVLGLNFHLDEAEGFAWLAAREPEEGETPLPRLMSRRQLSFPVSLMIALLRRKLAESDTQGGDLRLILDREDIVNLMRTFLPEQSNEARLVDQIDATINKVAELGFVRRLRKQPDKIEVRRIMVAFVDAQWLSDFDARLRQYSAHAAPDETATDQQQGTTDETQLTGEERDT